MKATSNIQMVIAAYEEEEIKLKKIISNCIEEEDFFMAKSHNTALNFVRQKLYELNCLNEVNYLERYAAEMSLLQLLTKLEVNNDPEQKDWLLRNIELKKEKLNKLNQNKQNKESNPDTNLTFKTIGDLLSNKIRRFSLIIDKKRNLRFQFSKRGKLFKTVIPEVKKVLPEYLPLETFIAPFEKQGFIYSRNKLTLTSIIESNQEEFADSLMQVLSQLCIEVFGVTDKNLDSYILIDEQATPKNEK